MSDFLTFLAALASPLYDLFTAVKSGGPTNEEHERQIAMRIIRAAKDAEARKEIEGG